jgi:transcriptional regulator with XRE-family HTH domain
MNDESANERMRSARERAGLTPEALATRIGITVPWYHDLEGDPEEASSTLSLAQLQTLASALGLPLRQILGGADAPPAGARVSPGELVGELRRRVAASGRSVEEIGSQIGWDIAPLMQDPAHVWQCNVDGLKDVCAFAQVDWTALLPDVPG